MPILDNARHEAFALALVSGKSATQAYISAGYSKNGAGPSAHALLKNPKISERVKELQGDIAQDTVMSAKEVLERLAKFAKGKDHLAVKALELLGKHHELFTEKHKTENRTEVEYRHAGARERLAAVLQGQVDRERVGEETKH